MSGKLSASGTAGPESPTQLLSQDRETPILNSAVPDAPQMAAASSSGEHRSASTQRTRPQPLSWSNGHASPDLTPREASVLGDRDPCSSQDQRPSLSQRVRTRLSLSRIRSISLTASACVSSVQETVSSLRDDALANPGPPLNQDQKIVSLRGADPETCPLAETRASSVYSNDEWDLSYYEEPRVEPPTSSESSTTAPPRADVARRAQSTGRQEIAYPPPESSGYCTASWDASGALHSRSLSTGARPYRRPATRLIVMVKRGSGVIPGNPSALENVRKRYKLPPYGESQVERAPTPPPPPPKDEATAQPAQKAEVPRKRFLGLSLSFDHPLFPTFGRKKSKASTAAAAKVDQQATAAAVAKDTEPAPERGRTRTSHHDNPRLPSRSVQTSMRVLRGSTTGRRLSPSEASSFNDSGYGTSPRCSLASHPRRPVKENYYTVVNQRDQIVSLAMLPDAWAAHEFSMKNPAPPPPPRIRRIMSRGRLA